MSYHQAQGGVKRVPQWTDRSLSALSLLIRQAKYPCDVIKLASDQWRRVGEYAAPMRELLLNMQGGIQ